MRYDYKCPKCGKIEEHEYSMNDNPLIKCLNCNTVMTRVFTTDYGFSIKGGTETMHWREKQKRVKRSRELDKKQKEKYGPGQEPVPNIAGVRQESWADCQKLAKESGMNHESYTPFVEKEKKKQKLYTGR